MEIPPVMGTVNLDPVKEMIPKEPNQQQSGPVVRAPSFVPPPVSQQEAPAISMDPPQPVAQAQSAGSPPSLISSVEQPNASTNAPTSATLPPAEPTVVPSATPIPITSINNSQTTVIPEVSDSSQWSHPTSHPPVSRTIPTLPQPSIVPTPSTSTVSPGSINLTNDPATNQIVTVSIWAGVGLLVFIGIITCIRRMNRRQKLPSNNLLLNSGEFGPIPPMTRSATAPTTVNNGGMKHAPGSYAVSAADLNEAIRAEKEALREDELIRQQQQQAAVAMAAGLMVSRPSPPQHHGLYTMASNNTGTIPDSTVSNGKGSSVGPGLVAASQPLPPVGAMPYQVAYHQPMYYNSTDSGRYTQTSSCATPPRTVVPNVSKPVYMAIGSSSPYMVPGVMGTPVLTAGTSTTSPLLVSNSQYLATSVPVSVVGNHSTGDSHHSGIQYAHTHTHPVQADGDMMTGSSVSSGSTASTSSSQADHARHRIVRVPTGKVLYHNKGPAPEAPAQPQVSRGVPHSSSTYDLSDDQ